MADINIPGNPPDNEEAKASQDKLQIIMEKIETLLKEELKEVDVDWFLQFRDHKNSISGHGGSGCPACAILRAIQWGLEVQLKHYESDVPFNPFPMPVSIVKMDREELLRKILELNQDVDEDETKH